MTHTPGPWDYCPEAHIVYAEGGDKDIASTWKFNGVPEDKTADEARDNARLIAAAPELLEACKYADSWLSDLLEAEQPEGFAEAIEPIRAAIAKATCPTYESSDTFDESCLKVGEAVKLDE